MASFRSLAVLTVLAGILAAVAAGLGVIYSGIVDVAATKPHYALTQWVLVTTMEHSVERRARNIAVPENLSPGPDAGAEYREMCELCHGGPGRDPSVIGQGLRPRPPDLRKVAGEAQAGELFWVVKNGIRMTGMPAFGPTHNDDKLWQIIALVKRLPQMSEKEYLSLEKLHKMH